MVLKPVIRLVGASHAPKKGPFTELMKRLGGNRLARRDTKAAQKAEADPYLLVLLADQELGDGRKEQARYLVDAAYDFFDRKAEGRVLKMNLAG